MRKFLVLLFLIGVWLLLSGLYKTLILFFGAISVIIVMFVMSEMERKDGYNIKVNLKVFSAFRYFFYLIKEISKSNFTVAKLLLSRKIILNQKFIHVPFSQNSEVGQVVFANSITLTPGTVTVELENEKFLVHALNADDSTANELSTMNKRVVEIEK